MKKILKPDWSMLANYFIAKEDADGNFSLTLSYLLGDILCSAQDLFGCRNTDYCILGVEFTASGPRCWTPSYGKYTIIQLSTGSVNDWKNMYREMAHECVHLLSPTGQKDATVLEEGLAVYFERWYIETTFGPTSWDGESIYGMYEEYLEALSLVDALLKENIGLIKILRLSEPTISRIPASLILETCPNTESSLAHRLTAPFYK